MPFKEIVKYICKGPSAISKEARNHRTSIPRNDFVDFGHCAKRRNCCLRNICKRLIPCKKQHSSCAECNKHCIRFIEDTCFTVAKVSYVYNGCSEKVQRRPDKYKYFYKATVPKK